MKPRRAFCLIFAVTLTACSRLNTPLPLTDLPPPRPLSSFVLIGHARAFRSDQGKWVREAGQDYDYLVLERRYATRWEAVKEIHHLNPGYDGRAGPRDQTLYFAVTTSAAADGGLDLAVSGTLGTGVGHASPNGAVMIELMPAQRGIFVPYDTIRIRQKREGVAGRMEEVVELFSRRQGGEVPFMKMEEEGVIYRPCPPRSGH